MNLSLFTHALEHLQAEAIVLFLFDHDSFADSPEFARYNSYSGGLLPSVYASGEFRGLPGESLLLHRADGLNTQRLLLIGGGKKSDFHPTQLRTAAGTALRLLKSKGIHQVALVLEAGISRADYVQAATEGVLLADFESDTYKTDPKRAEKYITEAILACPGASELDSALTVGQIVAEAQNFARALANEPPNILTPLELAARATKMATDVGLKAEVLDEAKMRELGMGALLGVAQGSAQPPCLIILKYDVAGTQPQPHLAIVGKAVTFDTGGISIKPSDGMEQMKFDMCGGAAAIGAMLAIAKLKPGIDVTAYIPAVENMPGHNAQRPGDIVKSYSGKTVEVLNTDAEGRLILIDAITYAKQHGATTIVDLATLTGAIGIALGTVNTGLFCNNENLQHQFLKCSRDAGEKMWPMPLDPEYKEQLKNAFADMPNIGTRGAGAITAAMFLAEWVEQTPWVHLDIASTAWINDAKPHLAKGPTGVGVRTLVKLVHELEVSS